MNRGYYYEDLGLVRMLEDLVCRGLLLFLLLLLLSLLNREIVLEDHSWIEDRGIEDRGIEDRGIEDREIEDLDS